MIYERSKIYERSTLITKPEQSGKTFIMIQEMERAFREGNGGLEEGKVVINIICCDNNLLLTKQTAMRVHEGLDEYIMNGETYIEFSSRKGNAANCSSAIFQAIVSGQQNIICCTNGKRVSDIEVLITSLNSSPFLGDKFTFKIWLDEADKFTNFITNTFIPLISSCENTHMYFITATPDALFRTYKGMNVFPLDETTGENYHGWKDNDIKIVTNDADDTEKFVHDVLTINRDLIQSGTKWYIPAGYKKTSHYMVKSICIATGMAVFVVNGDGLQLVLPGMEVIVEEKTDELNNQIMKLYKKYGLHNYPVAITGNLCVSRGISIMSPKFVFDYAILCSCTKKSHVSQSAGRLKGNIKNWANYKRPVVFTTQKFDEIASEWEEKSRKLAILAYKQQEEGETTVITEDQHYEIGGKQSLTNQHIFERGIEYFLTQEANETFAKTLGCKRRSNYTETEEGFKMCSTTVKKVHSFDEIEKFSRSRGICSNMDIPANSLKIGQYSKRRYVCYTDTSDITTERFVTIWVKRIN
jgi:hypothetical protein